MKNLIVKISSLLVLAIILMVVSAQAQSFRQYRAQIPFDFKIGKKVYDAGDYIINVRSINQLSAVLSIKNAKTHNLREMDVLTNGSRSLVKETVLMFDRYGDQYILTQIVSPDYGFSAPKSKAKNRIAQKFGQPEESVAIVLVKRDKNTE